MENKENIDEVYLTYIKENDYASGYDKGDRDYWYDGAKSHVNGSHICIHTDEHETIHTGPYKFKFFSFEKGFFAHVSPTRIVSCLKPIGVYAKYEGNCLYEMITGKEMITWKDAGTDFNLDKYVYYDHLVPANLNSVVEQLQYVNCRGDRIREYSDRLNKHQIEAIQERVKKELEAKNDPVKQYINNYKRPNR